MHNKRAIWSVDSIIIYSKLSLTSVIIPGTDEVKYFLAKYEARNGSNDAYRFNVAFEIVSDNFGRGGHPVLMD